MNQGNAKSYRPSEAQLVRWLDAASPGDQVCYHRGFLAVDCDPAVSSLTDEDRCRLQMLAQKAWSLTQVGRADLVQLRNGPGDFTYLLIARNRVRGSPSAF
jgi:hypothetical protein